MLLLTWPITTQKTNYSNMPGLYRVVIFSLLRCIQFAYFDTAHISSKFADKSLSLPFYLWETNQPLQHPACSKPSGPSSKTSSPLLAAASLSSLPWRDLSSMAPVYQTRKAPPIHQDHIRSSPSAKSGSEWVVDLGTVPSEETATIQCSMQQMEG